ncbi:MAG: VWA domain-containing protein [Proteobacteria bacterium]|nr:VWA domain-containing protein [Pseudomonadota bacterium]
MSGNKTPTTRSSSGDVTAFLNQAAKTPVRAPGAKNGRLIFAMDATASRGPTWAQAMAIQSDMFKEAATVGGLDVQLVYYRGVMDFGASPWLGDPARVANLMRTVDVEGGNTQIVRVLRHALAASKASKVNAMVFIGDAVEESQDAIADAAGQLGLQGVPVFVFHEGAFGHSSDPAGRVFRQIARITRGAYSTFDANSAQQLRDLLKAVAVFAAGGRKALEDYGAKTGGAALQITHQVSGKT